MRGTEIGTDLRDELAAIAAPDTPAGREAAKYLGQFGSRPLATMAEAQRRVRSLPESLPLRQSVSSFDELELVLAQAFSDMTTAQFVIMENIPSLRKSFEDADSCKELVALGSD